MGVLRRVTLRMPIWSVPRINDQGPRQLHSESGSWQGAMRRFRGLTSDYPTGIVMRDRRHQVQSLGRRVGDP